MQIDPAIFEYPAQLSLYEDGEQIWPEGSVIVFLLVTCLMSHVPNLQFPLRLGEKPFIGNGYIHLNHTLSYQSTAQDADANYSHCANYWQWSEQDSE